MAILFHLIKHVFGYAKGLREAGLDVEVQKAKEGSGYEPLDFTSDRPKILTYHSAKGLTFDTVIMPQLVERAFYRKRESAVDRLLFVGITPQRDGCSRCDIILLTRMLPFLDKDIAMPTAYRRTAE